MVKIRTTMLVFAAMLAAATALSAQSSTQYPVLHRRIYTQVDEDLDTGTRSSGRTMLPADASGEYVLGGGGAIDVELQPDRLSGFINRLGDRASDEGEPLTFFFATSRLSGPRMAFTTRRVHGVWFSFDGTIVRGTAVNRGQQGYYLLQGRLVLHGAATKSRTSAQHHFWMYFCDAQLEKDYCSWYTDQTRAVWTRC